ncbi:MAG: GreA/GreB family elongation factor [Chloroflexi bacterium]|nr:GreA/GreB family elongation factor [Chloroflexota bacterium]
MKAQIATDGPVVSSARIPMTSAALRRLELEIDRLVGQFADSRSTAWEAGISGEQEAPTFMVNGELHVLERRLEKLQASLAGAELVEPDGRALVGSRVTIDDAEGARDVYDLVAPGEADANAGRISSESPLGAALLGRGAGDEVEIVTTAGRRRLTLVRVD